MQTAGNSAYPDVPIWLRVGEGDLRAQSGGWQRSFVVTDESGNRRLHASAAAVAEAYKCAESTVFLCLKENRPIRGKYHIEEVL